MVAVIIFLGAYHYGVDPQQLGLALNTDMQPIVIKLLIINAVNHFDIAPITARS